MKLLLAHAPSPSFARPISVYTVLTGGERERGRRREREELGGA